MKVVGREKLMAFIQRDATVKSALAAWLAEAEASDWPTPLAIKQRYASASLVGKDRVVINLKGNRYRLVLRVNYAQRLLQVRFVGTHAEYDKIKVEEV